MFGNAGIIQHPSVYFDGSKHLVQAGFVHVDYLRSLADDRGLIHVDQLPKQEIKYIPPHRGQQTSLNAASKWVPVETEPPAPIRLPDVRALTAEERAVLVAQLEANGDISHPTPHVEKARVE